MTILASLLLILNYVPLLTSSEQSVRTNDRGCADFNYGAAAAARAGLEYVFVCPADGIANVLCTESFPIKNSTAILQSLFTWDDIVIYMLAGPRSKFDAFMWWLPLMTDPFDLVIVADACPNDAKNCTDVVQQVADDTKRKHPNVRLSVVRAHGSDSGYNILSCKLRTGAKQVYAMHPQKKIYFKIDTDTILLPRRFLSFLYTLDSIVENPLADNSSTGTPFYFGTVEESGMHLLLCGRDWSHLGKVEKGGLCYAQGGAGYGLNNFAMRLLASAPRCDPKTPDKSPEDTFTAMRVFSHRNTTVVHCAGFSSSEIVTDRRLRGSISFHYIDSKWLRTYGERLMKHIHNPS